MQQAPLPGKPYRWSQATVLSEPPLPPIVILPRVALQAVVISSALMQLHIRLPHLPAPRFSNGHIRIVQRNGFSLWHFPVCVVFTFPFPLFAPSPIITAPSFLLIDPFHFHVTHYLFQKIDSMCERKHTEPSSWVRLLLFNTLVPSSSHLPKDDVIYSSSRVRSVALCTEAPLGWLRVFAIESGATRRISVLH